MVKINIVRDMKIYDSVFETVIPELKNKGIEVVESRTYGLPDMKYSICVQSGDRAGAAGASGKIFYINHGLSCIKGWGIPKQVNIFLASTQYWADGIQAQTDKLNLDRISIVTGWPKMDIYYELKKKRNEIRESLFERYTNGKERPIIMIKPTYNKANSDHSKRKYSIKEIYTRLSAVKDKYLILMSLHQMETAELPINGICLSHGSHGIDISIASDVVICDRGSVVFECSAANIPIVMVDNPDTPGFLHLESKRDYPKVDAGPHITNETLIPFVDKIIEQPMWYEERRKYWGDLIAGQFDGKNTERVVNAIVNYIKNNEGVDEILHI